MQFLDIYNGEGFKDLVAVIEFIVDLFFLCWEDFDLFFLKTGMNHLDVICIVAKRG